VRRSPQKTILLTLLFFIFVLDKLGRIEPKLHYIELAQLVMGQILLVWIGLRGALCGVFIYGGII
jgi:hypothetical protein